jgi:zinc transporter 9
MLFSAGTFLYVATVHVLPEVGSPFPRNFMLKRKESDHLFFPVQVTSLGKDHSSGFSKSELAMLVVGAILPLFLTIGHHH